MKLNLKPNFFTNATGITSTILMAISFNASANPNTNLTMPKHASMNIPLNQYGAVDVNAKVPLSIQVPPAPQDLKLPPLKTAIETWSNSLPAQPSLNVKSYILEDVTTGNILAQYNANDRIAPASLTKLMLLYIVEQQLKRGTLTLNTMLTVPTVAWATGGSRMYLKPNTKVSVKDLLLGVIVDSGNDAAVTLATSIAGTQSAFVDIMNQTAKQLGMTNTHFSDVMGLPAPNLYSSAHDLAILARAVILDFPEYYSLYKEKYFTYNGIKQSNYNKLLFKNPYADGLKTGSTSSAGYSLIGSENKPGRPRLLAVVIGAPNLQASANYNYALLKYGDHSFTTKQFYSANNVLEQIKVYGGSIDKINIGTKQPISLTYPRWVKQGDLKFNLKTSGPNKAPIEEGQQLGTLNLSYQGKIIDTYPVVALESSQLGSWWQRVKGKVSLWF